MAKSTSTGLSGEIGSDALDDDMDLLDTDLTEGDDWDDQLDHEASPPPKKKGGMFNIIIILVGILIFGGIVYSKLAMAPPGGVEPQVATAPDGGDVPAPQKFEPSTTATAATTTTVPVETQATEAGPLTPMPDFGEASQMPQADTSSRPAPVSVPGSDIVPPVVTLTPNDSVSPTSLDTGVTENAGAGGLVAVPVPEPQPTAQKDGLTTDISQEFSTVNIKPIEGGPVDKAIPLKADSQPDVVSKPILPNAEGGSRGSAPLVGHADSPDAAKMAELVEQVKFLSDRLAILEKNEKKSLAVDPAHDMTPEKVQSDDRSDAVDVAIDTVRTDVSAPVPETVRVRQMAKIHYVLRGVSGGTAYVARSVTSPVIRVQVGDRIEGMGTVKDIRMNASGRWAVLTTAGTISSR